MTQAPGLVRNLLPCAGLIVGPVLWALNTQLGLSLPYLTCGARLPVGALIAIAGALLSLGAGLVSWRATHEPGERTDPAPAYRASAGFVGGLGGWAGLLFAYALLLQGLASFALSGCER